MVEILPTNAVLCRNNSWKCLVVIDFVLNAVAMQHEAPDSREDGLIDTVDGLAFTEQMEPAA